MSLSPTLRIDYILPDFRWDVKQFTIIDEALSDHFLLLADLELKK
jgi:endonuclease/exonuclease/phosphatase family metal-dependent hydrolase